jgi:hypothetical protein
MMPQKVFSNYYREISENFLNFLAFFKFKRLNCPTNKECLPVTITFYYEYVDDLPKKNQNRSKTNPKQYIPKYY